MTLAASLERFGMTPTVVEIADGALSRGLALMLTSNVCLALRRVGLEDAVIERGITLERIVHLDPSGDLAEDPLDLGPSNARYGPNLGITRDGLISTLSAAVQARIRYSTTVTEVDQSAREVTVAFSDGVSGRFDLLVGADGVGSTVRKVLYPELAPAYRSFCAWRTVMDTADCDAVFRLSTTTGRFLGSFPVGRNLMYAFLLAHYTEFPAASRENRLELLKELAAGFRGNVSPLIQEQHDAGRLVFVPVEEVETPSYFHRRILLIGDAAHAFSPLLAQGAAMAIEDAVTLAELIGGSSEIDEALREYERRRRPRVEAIRAGVRYRGLARGMEGPVTAEQLRERQPVFSRSLRAFEELIEDPFLPT